MPHMAFVEGVAMTGVNQGSRARQALLALCALGALTVSSACGSSGQEASDCPTALRIGGATYTWNGSTEHAGVVEGVAEVSSCDDQGRDARGIYFPRNPEHTTYLTFAGLDPDAVVGTRSDNGTVAYFLADRLAATEVARIQSQLKDS
jgi:hypothetical protein